MPKRNMIKQIDCYCASFK